MIIVDPCRWTWKGQKWAHLGSTHSVEELHAFAKKLKIAPCWFQNRKYPHYDINKVKYELVIKAGAKKVTSKMFVLSSITKPGSK